MADQKGSSAVNLEKSKLQDMIVSMLKPTRPSSRKAFTVAVIGTVGVGKSSLINSIATAMSKERWREHAITGFHGGEADPVTPYIKMYPQCCREEEHENDLIPTLLDIGGLPNELSYPWPEVLGLIFSGRVPDKENLMNVHGYLLNRTDTERSPYQRVNQQMKVDRVVVVGSATAQVPETLFKAVVRAAKPKRGINSRDIPIFGVMTKYDLIDAEAKEKFGGRERKFKAILGLEGAETRYLCCRNYCEANDPEEKRVQASIPELDIPILRWMLQICDPHIRVVTQEPSTWGEQFAEMKEQWLPVFWKAIQQFQSYDLEVQKLLGLLVFAIVFIFLVVFVFIIYRLMSLI